MIRRRRLDGQVRCRDLRGLAEDHVEVWGVLNGDVAQQDVGSLIELDQPGTDLFLALRIRLVGNGPPRTAIRRDIPAVAFDDASHDPDGPAADDPDVAAALSEPVPALISGLQPLL